MSKKIAMAAFTAAQKREADAIASVHDLDAQLQAAVRTEAEAAVAALDGDGKALRDASKSVQQLTDRLRIARIQAVVLTDRRKDAAAVLSEAEAEQARVDAEVSYRAYVASVGTLNETLAKANEAIRTCRESAEQVRSQYLAGGGSRTATLHSFHDRLRQQVVDRLTAVSLLETSGREVDLLGPVAAFVSAIGAGRPAPAPRTVRADDQFVFSPFDLDEVAE